MVYESQRGKKPCTHQFKTCQNNLKSLPAASALAHQPAYSSENSATQQYVAFMCFVWLAVLH